MRSIIAALITGVAPSAVAFNIEPPACISRNNLHRRAVSSPIRSALFSAAPKSSTSAATKPKKQKSSPAIPTARFVAISSLASAAASAFAQCSSPGAGAQVNTGSFATRQLEQDDGFKSMDARDRAFSRLLIATVERRSGQIDKVLKCCVRKYPPKGKHAPLIQATLRTGVAQLLFLRTPPFAAIKETVQVLRMRPNNVPEPMIKFVNGVLRNLSRPPDDADEMLGQQLLREKTSAMDNIAPWLLKRWRNDWGEERAKLVCEEMMPSDESNVGSRIHLTTKYSLGSSDGVVGHTDELKQLMSKLGEDSILLPQGSIRVGPSLKGDVKSWPEYDEGTWWVQDASSTLPASILTKALFEKYPQDERTDIHVVDMCAAPGGKTSQLISAGFGHVTAIEASPRRSRRLTENLDRLGFSEKCEVVVEEGQNWSPSGEQSLVHGILVDVPCSATGTGARRPDVLRRDSDLNELLQTQQELANHCADLLGAGGIMVYATCSILKEESEDQVQKLLDRDDLEVSHIQSQEVPGFKGAIDDRGWLRVLPGVLEGDLRSTDGFFVARLIKK